MTFQIVKGVLITCILKSMDPMGLLVKYGLAFGLVRQTAAWNIERTQRKLLNHELLGIELNSACM